MPIKDLYRMFTGGIMNRMFQIKSAGGEFTINPIDDSGIEITYPKQIISQVDLEGEVNAVISRLDFNHHANFVVFGLRNVRLIEEIINRMSDRSFILIIEKSLNQTFIFEASNGFIQKLLKSKLVLMIADTHQEVCAKFSKITNDVHVLFNMSHLQIIKMPYLESLFPSFVQTIHQYIMDNTSTKIVSVGNDVTDTLKGIQNQINNLKISINSPRVKHLKDIYKNTPAIMVGAGPSVTQAFDLIKDYKDKALIFAVDTVTRKLYEYGIAPDAMATIERDDIVYERYYQGTDYNENTVFIGPSVVDSRTFTDLQNAVILHRLGDAVSRDVCHLLDDVTIEMGLNCANVSFGLLKYMGCDPIIMVGQELAFAPTGEKYFGDQQATYDPIEDASERVYDVLGNDGIVLKSLRNYMDAKTWFEQEIGNDNVKRNYYNCTVGGAIIKGTTYAPLKDVLEKHCHKNVVRFTDIINEIANSQEKVNHEAFVDRFTYLRDCFGELKDYANDLLSQMNELETLSPDECYQKILSNRDELHKFMFERNTMTWIIQSIYFSYDSRLFAFPYKNLTQQEMSSLKNITSTYYTTLVESCTKIVDEFDLYLKVIKHNLGVEDYVE